MNVLIGPPGAGKTRAVLKAAIEAAREGHPGVIATLPPAWRHLTRRLALEAGAVLGVEVRHLQAVYTEILAAAGRLAEPFDRTDRLVTVASLLTERTPGRARLFAGAIGELKRYGLGPENVEPFDDFTEELKAVYRQYEERLRELGIQDLDDRRLEAIRALEEGHNPQFAFFALDGLREVTPLELRFLERLSANGVRVLLTLPRPVPGLSGIQTLPERELPTRHFLLDNPVNEARFVLTEALRALEAGVHPAEIAVVVPEGLAPLYREVARSLGVALADELLRLVEVDAAAATLYEALGLVDFPTAGALRRIEGLGPLAALFGEWGAGGLEVLEHALGLVGEETRARWEEVRIRLDPRTPDPNWVEGVLSFLGLERAESAEALLRAGYRAVRAASDGDGVRTWWRHLLEDLRVRPPEAGIVFTSPERLAGRRFLRVFLAGATASQYAYRTVEDFFFPEEKRTALERVFSENRLPYRFRDQTDRFFEELRGAGETLTITAHRSSGGGLEDPHPFLFPDPDTVPWAVAPRPVYRGTYGPPPAGLEGFAPRSLDAIKMAGLCATRYLFRDLLEKREPKPFYRVLEEGGDRELLELLGLEVEPKRVIRRYRFQTTLDGAPIRATVPVLVQDEYDRLHLVFPGYDYEPEPEDGLAAAALAEKGYRVAVYTYRLNNEKLYASRKYPAPREEVEAGVLEKLERIRRGETLHATVYGLCGECNLRPICRKP